MHARNDTVGTPRDISLDALRGIAVAVLVLSHIVTEAVVHVEHESIRRAGHVVLYLFNVQLFAFISGCLSVRVDLRRKARSLLVPLASWLLVFALFSGSEFFQTLSVSDNGVRGVLSGFTPLWFLWGLFVSFCIVKVLDRNPVALFAAAVGFAFAWPFVPAWTGLRGVGLLLIYLLLGRELFRRRELPGGLPRPRPLLALLVFLSAAMVLLEVLESPLWVGAGPPRHLLLVQSVGVAAGVSACLGLFFVATRLRGALVRALAYVGTASMGVYGFHWLLIVLFPEALRARHVALIPVYWAALLAASLLLTGLVNNVPVLRRALLGGRILRPVSFEGSSQPDAS